jgi:hypothetical protein
MHTGNVFRPIRGLTSITCPLILGCIYTLLYSTLTRRKKEGVQHLDVPLGAGIRKGNVVKEARKASQGI